MEGVIAARSATQRESREYEYTGQTQGRRVKVKSDANGRSVLCSPDDWNATTATGERMDRTEVSCRQGMNGR